MFPRPWDSPGKNTGVGCHFLLQAWKWKVKVKSPSCVRQFATPWTTANQAPPPVGFSRQEYWSGVPLPSLVLLKFEKANPDNNDTIFHCAVGKNLKRLATCKCWQSGEEVYCLPLLLEGVWIATVFGESLPAVFINNKKAILFWGLYSTEIKVSLHKEIWMRIFTASLFRVGKKTENHPKVQK